MGDLLVELGRVLRSKQERLTSVEAEHIESCKSMAVKEFFAGALVGQLLALSVAWRLSKLMKITLSAASATTTGCWRFDRYLNSCIDDILSRDGSRMQRELAIIIVNKHWDNPSRMQLLTRRFYWEKVFDDFSSDEPILRLHFRKFFSDNIAFPERSHGSDSYDSSLSNTERDSDSMSNNKSRIVPHHGSDSRKNDLLLKQVIMNTGADVIMEDPLDCVFGSMTSMEEVNNPNSSSTPIRRGRRRSHRRH